MRRLVESTLAHGGQVSYKANADGSRSPYELNITWYDALNDPARPAPEADVARFLASQAIMLALAGVPGIYVHSLFGSRSCHKCSEETGQARSLNREKFWLAEIRRDLADPDTLRARVFGGYRHLLRVYREQFGAHPGARQRVVRLGAGVFALLRTADDGHRVLCLTNVTAEAVRVEIDLAAHRVPAGGRCVDALSGETPGAQDEVLNCLLRPYQTRWLVL